MAIPRTRAWYAGDPASGLRVTLGNVLIGEWMEVDRANHESRIGLAVRIEVDNQDVPNEETRGLHRE